MTPADLDAVLSGGGLTLPARPAWSEYTTRAGERRAVLPVLRNGSQTDLSVVLVVKLNDRSYFVANLIAADKCVARFCLTGGHRDLRSFTFIEGPHYHSWFANRPKGDRIPKNFELSNAEPAPVEIRTNDQGFDFFLRTVGIESPRWLPVAWPHNLGLL